MKKLKRIANYLLSIVCLLMMYVPAIHTQVSNKAKEIMLFEDTDQLVSRVISVNQDTVEFLHPHPPKSSLLAVDSYFDHTYCVVLFKSEQELYFGSEAQDPRFYYYFCSAVKIEDRWVVDYRYHRIFTSGEYYGPEYKVEIHGMTVVDGSNLSADYSWIHTPQFKIKLVGEAAEMFKEEPKVLDRRETALFTICANGLYDLERKKRIGYRFAPGPKNSPRTNCTW